MKFRFLASCSQFFGILFAALFLVSCSRQRNAGTITISNVEPRLDIKGQIVDAHGGCVQYFNGRFYLYGTAFGTNLDYDAFNCPLVVYSSPDMQTWTFEGSLLKSPPNGVFYRPYVVFNPKTKKYVAWYNWYPKLWQGQDGVAVSDNPVGPFVIVNQKAHIAGSSPGDGSLFVDDDGTGYYIYTDIAKDYSVRVERLTSDFLDSSGNISKVIATGAEAPVMFRRNNYYYVLNGPLCASCPNGSEVQVFVSSSSALGPYFTNPSLNINHEEINTNQATTENASSQMSNPSAQSMEKGRSSAPLQINNPVIHAQETWVARIPVGAGSMYIWMGDRWEANPDGLIAHDSQYWVPLDFAPDGQILPLKVVSSWSITRAANH